MQIKAGPHTNALNSDKQSLPACTVNVSCVKGNWWRIAALEVCARHFSLKSLSHSEEAFQVLLQGMWLCCRWLSGRWGLGCPLSPVQFGAFLWAEMGQRESGGMEGGSLCFGSSLHFVWLIPSYRFVFCLLMHDHGLSTVFVFGKLFSSSLGSNPKDM